MVIETELQLKAHLKIFKMKLKNSGQGQYDYYPAFCAYYQKRMDRYKMSKEIVMEHAMDILIG